MIVKREQRQGETKIRQILLLIEIQFMRSVEALFPLGLKEKRIYRKIDGDFLIT
jgi:hypothetical protein